MVGSRKLNCADLLRELHRTESFLPESADSHFGHPPPPKLVMAEIGSRSSSDSGKSSAETDDGPMLLVVASTHRCVSAQVLLQSREDGEGGGASEVVEIMCVPDEKIECASIVLHPFHENMAAVVVGTDHSRVLSVELTSRKSSTKNIPVLARTNGIMGPPFEAFPLDPFPMGGGGKDGHFQPYPTNDESFSDSRHIAGAPTVKKSDFHPQGGVNSIESYDIDKETDLIWISYHDGTLLRIAPFCFFPSVAHEETVDYAQDFVRLQVVLSPNAANATNTMSHHGTIMACPRHHPSPLAPVTPWKPDELDLSSDSGDDEGEREGELVPEFFEALIFGGPNDPCLLFYTSEDQFMGRVTGDSGGGRSSHEESVLFDQAIGATSALVRGVVGTAMGVVRWGWSNHHPPAQDVPVDDSLEMEHERLASHPLLEAIHDEPRRLFAGFELHDFPRMLSSVTMDHWGDMAATTDTLGRVLLVDLATKQVVRMWKGVREASCHWMGPDGRYLCIHSRQRRTVEVWKVRYGGRVESRSVGRDSQIVSCTKRRKGRTHSTCYLLQSATLDSTSNNLQEIVPREEVVSSVVEPTVASSAKSSGTIKEAAYRLRTLQQLLANTNVPCQKQDVYVALTEITSLTDLATALDILAFSSSLEDRMDVSGAEFQKDAIAYCEQILDSTTCGKGPAVSESAPVTMLKSRIQYHSQIVKAYEALFNFQREGAQPQEDDDKSTPRSAWAVEAMSWLTTHSTVTGNKLGSTGERPKNDIARFSTFAKSCASAEQTKQPESDNQPQAIFLNDSSKTRREILVHIFEPLLCDIFSFGVTSTIFEHLGVKQDVHYMQKCFGEWFMTLSAKEASEKAFFGLYSPIVRWMDELVRKDLECSSVPGENGTSIILSTLHEFCTVSDDLVRSFGLAVLCREAASAVTKKRELRTYGAVLSIEAVKPWDVLLRKLRVCLLVSLRLHGQNLGAFPVTVRNVESGDIFSIFSWVARDELSSSHNHRVIASLEKACKISGLVFHPSTSVGDNPTRWKMLQKACLVNAISEAERAEYLVDLDDDVQGALLLYLSNYNIPAILVAHRSLLLAEEWGQKPSDQALLRECVVSLSALDESSPYKALAVAVRLEIWQNMIRPIYRALIFGFEDVHELSEELFLPLFSDRAWLLSVGKAANDILTLLSKIKWKQPSGRFEVPQKVVDDSWPPVGTDFVLERLLQRSRRVDPDSIDLHRAIVCSCMISNDFESLSYCVNGLYESFLPSSLFDVIGQLSGDSAKQMEFLEQGIMQLAESIQGDILDQLDLGEIDTLALLWGIEVRDVSTIFLLAMYEYGKDILVDDLLTKSVQRMDLDRFVEDGLGLACRRLNRFMNIRSPEIRSAWSLLDPETCEWIREQAEESAPLIDEAREAQVEVPLSSTHLFILRLLSFSSAIGAKSVREKVHSLSILSGTLLKALETPK